MSILKVEDLKLVRGKKTLCSNLTIKFKPGQVWGILGRNGSGKSTLLHCLAGLYPPEKGNIFLERIIEEEKKHTDVYHISRNEIAKHIALLLQLHDRPLYSTVFETVLSARFAYLKPWQWETTYDIELCDKALRVMEINHIRDEYIANLSGGELRRVALARILVQQTKILLLDEPTNHLDLKHKILVLKYLRELTMVENRLVIMVMHDINLVNQFCDKVLLFFGNGKCQFADKQIILTQDNLQELYDYPLQKITSEAVEYWLAK